MNEQKHLNMFSSRTANFVMYSEAEQKFQFLILYLVLANLYSRYFSSSSTRFMMKNMWLIERIAHAKQQLNTRDWCVNVFVANISNAFITQHMQRHNWFYVLMYECACTNVFVCGVYSPVWVLFGKKIWCRPWPTMTALTIL